MDEVGETEVWLTGVTLGKITDFAGEADAADAPGLRDYSLVTRLALLVCLIHKARIRARDDLTTMFCKRVALQVKRAKAELEAIREQQQAIVEALIGNYCTVLQHIDAGAALIGGRPEYAGNVRLARRDSLPAATAGSEIRTRLTSQGDLGVLVPGRPVLISLVLPPDHDLARSRVRGVATLAHAWGPVI
ncbi:hypothetical protein ACWC4A_47830 [Streptomyces mirabilis]